MSFARPMTSFTRNTWNQGRHVKVAAGGRGGGVAPETESRLGSGHGAPQRSGKIRGKWRTMSQSQIQPVQRGIKTYAAFIEGAISLENICLSHFTGSECPIQGLCKRVCAITHGIQNSVCSS